LGRFGSFWGQCLADYLDVTGYNRSIRTPWPDKIKKGTEDEVLDSDVLVLCVAISAIKPVLERIRDRIRPDCLVMDTCSVKVYPVETMKTLLPETVQILGTHPMFGPDSGADGVSSLPLVFTPVRMTDEQIDFWRNLFLSMKLDLIEMTADQHDREAAYTQGITHFIGRTLKDLDLKSSRIGTAGYRSLFNIMEQTCNDPWQLFHDLQHYNPYTEGMRTELMTSLDRILVELHSFRDV